MRGRTQARAAIKEIVEMPNAQIDRIIRSAQSNKGNLSDALSQENPTMADPGIWDAIVQAIERAFNTTPRSQNL